MKAGVRACLLIICIHADETPTTINIFVSQLYGALSPRGSSCITTCLMARSMEKILNFTGREVFKCSFTSRNSKGARDCGGRWQHISWKEQKNRILMSSCSCAAVSIVGPSGKAYYLFHKCRADIHWGTEHRMRDNFWRVVASPFTIRGPGPSSQQPATGLVLFSFLPGLTVNHNQASIYCVTLQRPTLR